MAAIEETATTRPPPRSFIPASAGCRERKAPVRFTSSSARQASGSIVAARASRSATPALATTAPTGPSSASIRS